MAIIMPEEQSNEFELTPEGGFLCVCYRIIDLGTQRTEFNGEAKTKRKIMISWEIPEEKMKDGRPFSIHKRYTLSSSDKAELRKDLESWRGKKFTKEEFGSFDLGVLLGKPCYLQVVHNEKGERTYANISAIMSTPKSTDCPPLTNEPVYFSLDEFDKDIYATLSDGLKDIISKSPEYLEAVKPKEGLAY